MSREFPRLLCLILSSIVSAPIHFRLVTVIKLYNPWRFSILLSRSSYLIDHFVYPFCNSINNFRNSIHGTVLLSLSLSDNPTKWNSGIIPTASSPCFYLMLTYCYLSLPPPIRSPSLRIASATVLPRSSPHLLSLFFQISPDLICNLRRRRCGQ